MNNKGFTLIELIVTIALLAVIAVISFVSITNVINENQNKECQNIENNLKNAAKSYISDNRYTNNNWNCDGENGWDVEITAKVLLDNNYLTKEITNPYTSEIIDSNNLKVAIELDKSCRPLTVSITGLPNNCQG